MSEETTTGTVMCCDKIPGSDRPPTLQCAICLKKQDPDALFIHNNGWICPDCAYKIGKLIGVRADYILEKGRFTGERIEEVADRLPKEVWDEARKKVLESGNQSLWCMFIEAIEILSEFWTVEHEEET